MRVLPALRSLRLHPRFAVRSLQPRGCIATLRERATRLATKVEGKDQMAQIDNRYAGRVGARTDVAVDAGLRAYMLRVYNYMAAGIALTGIVAYVIFSNAVTTDPALAVTA